MTLGWLLDPSYDSLPLTAWSGGYWMREGITIKANGSPRLIYGMLMLPLVVRVRIVRAHPPFIIP